jgi:hypothetical protein
MNKSTKFLLLTNVVPGIRMGLIGGLLCLVTPTEAKIPSAMAMALITGYASRWGGSVGRHLVGLPVGSYLSGLSVAEIQEMYVNPQLARQTIRNTQELNKETLKFSQRDKMNQARRRYMTPLVKANAYVSAITTVAALVIGGAAWVELKPVVSHYFSADTGPSQTDKAASSQTKPMRPFSFHAVGNIPVILAKPEVIG